MCFASPVFALSYILDLNSKKLTELLNINDSRASGINDAGQIVGSVNIDMRPGFFYSYRAFITGPNGVGVTELGTLWGQESFANGVNSTGQVVGHFRSSDNSYGYAFITGPNGVGMTNLGELNGGGFNGGTAYDINDAGQVVGGAVNRAFITGRNGVGMTDLGTLGGDWSAAYAINNTGQVVGISATATGGQTAFITGPNGVGMTELETLGGNWSTAYDINNAGQVVGELVGMNKDRSSYYHAFVTGPNGAGMTDLGTLGGNRSYATAINNAGQVVGSSFTATDGEHAFITGPNGMGMTDLNSLVDLPPGYILTNAIDINNKGQILVQGVAPMIPEPQSYALMLAGLSLIGFVAWRQKSANRV